MGTWMQIKYENTSMPAVQLLNQSQFLIIIQNWELGYCPDKRQTGIFGRPVRSSTEFHCPLPHEPKGLISTESCWWWWRGAGGMLTIFPFWPTPAWDHKAALQGWSPWKEMQATHRKVCWADTDWCICILPFLFFPRPVWFMIQLEQQTVYLIFILKHCCYPWDLIKIASFGTYQPPYC